MMKKHELDRLVTDAQTGNSKAFAAVYGLFANDLYRFALYFTGNSADAQDCVQDAVLLAFRNLPSLKKPSSFKSWLFKILSNVCKEKLTNPADSFTCIPIHEVQTAEREPSVMQTELSAELSDALDQLSAEEKQIVLLSVIGRYKSGEIAQMLGMSPGTVRSKLSRSLAKLREILQ